MFLKYWAPTFSIKIEEHTLYVQSAGMHMPLDMATNIKLQKF